MIYPILEEFKNNYPTAEFSGYDPLVKKEDIENLGLKYESSIEEAFCKKNISIILTNHSEFENLALTNLIITMNKPSIVYDLWNNYNPRSLDIPEGYGYLGFGNLKNASLP